MDWMDLGFWTLLETFGSTQVHNWMRYSLQVWSFFKRHFDANMFHMPSGGHRMSSPVTITDYFKIVNQLVINLSRYEGIRALSLYLVSFIGTFLYLSMLILNAVCCVFSVLNCNCVSWLCIRNLLYHVTTLHVGLMYIFTRVSWYINKTSCLFCSQHPPPSSLHQPHEHAAVIYVPDQTRPFSVLTG